jgi:alkylation response protein AidB-like acyl-CoA dehydrogenase
VSVVEAAADLRSIIRGYQEEIDRERRIPPALVEQMRPAGLYRLLVPRALGGLQLDLLTYFRVVELVSEGDGSVGWNIATSSAAQLVSLSLPDAGVREVFADGPDARLAGTVVPGGGRGVRVEGGYLVNGRWRFGSGCQESQWMLGNFYVDDADDKHVLLRAVFPSRECTIVDTWDVTGLRGTGSHDWTVSDVFVPEHRTVPHAGNPVNNRWRRWPGTLYDLPVHAVIGPHHSPVASGAARAAVDALADLAGAKIPRARAALLREQVFVQEAVGKAEAMLGAAQAYRTSIARELWDTVEAGQQPTLDQQARCRLAATYATDCALQVVELMYRAGGTTSLQRPHQIARSWRDVHAVAQTAGLHPEWYALTGRVFLGLDAGPRLMDDRPSGP